MRYSQILSNHRNMLDSSAVADRVAEIEALIEKKAEALGKGKVLPFKAHG
jgi:hypothetical protein